VEVEERARERQTEGGQAVEVEEERARVTEEAVEVEEERARERERERGEAVEVEEEREREREEAVEVEEEKAKQLTCRRQQVYLTSSSSSSSFPSPATPYKCIHMTCRQQQV
jgi:D-alanine-D-alanine ligase-like ATP-grasp enzyme